MDLRLFFKNKFLKRNFGDFVKLLDNSDYNQFKNVLKQNSSWYVPSSIFDAGDKDIKELFDSIDGSTMTAGTFGNKSKNSTLEEQELYDWVKFNYKQFKNKDITDNDLKNMSMSEFMEIANDYAKKLKEDKKNKKRAK